MRRKEYLRANAHWYRQYSPTLANSASEASAKYMSNISKTMIV